MKAIRLRDSVLGMIGLVALGALASLGLRERGKRHGEGAPNWQAAIRFDRLARFDLAKAREYRDCPGRHTPWNGCYQCPGCLAAPVPTRAHHVEGGRIPIDVPLYRPNSAPGRALMKRFRDQHEAVAREYEAKAALAGRLRDRHDRATSRPSLDPFPLSEGDKRVDQSNGLSRKYQYDWS